MLRGLKDRFPQVHLKAFTMVEIGYLAQRAKLGPAEVLQKLKDAGMDSLPGGGAKNFSPKPRPAAVSATTKSPATSGWKSPAPRTRLGLHSNCTMLCGHIETEEDRVDHLIRKLRALTRTTRKGFVTFIPLAISIPLQHCPSSTSSTTTGSREDLRQIAVSRLMLDNIPHIKAYWIMMTPRDCPNRPAFRLRANIDGTVVEEKIYHDAGATTSRKTSAGANYYA